MYNFSYVNHTCKNQNAANYMYATKDGIPLIYFCTVKDVKATEEIFIDYKGDFFKNNGSCKCKSCESDQQRET